MQISQEFYVLLSNDNIVQGMDRDSGGYPINAKNLNQAYFWTNLEECEGYARMFYPKFKVGTAVITITV